MKDYTVKVDKALLKEFLTCDVNKVSGEHIEEVKKVMGIVMKMFFNKYYHMSEDLQASALTIILSRRDHYSPDKDAYNYIFTQSRNEIGNNIYRWTKEVIKETEYEQPCSGHQSLDGLPSSVVKYKHYLTGEASYTIKRIARKDATDILIWLRLHEQKPPILLPDYIQNTENTVSVLYKLVKDLVSTE